jgi:hypothetical protein
MRQKVMENKNKNTGTIKNRSCGEGQIGKNGVSVVDPKTSKSDKIVREFVSDFYVKYGRIMTRLAYE